MHTNYSTAEYAASTAETAGEGRLDTDECGCLREASGRLRNRMSTKKRVGIKGELRADECGCLREASEAS